MPGTGGQEVTSSTLKGVLLVVLPPAFLGLSARDEEVELSLMDDNSSERDPEDPDIGSSIISVFNFGFSEF
ncbi:MAG: hypothetical protein ACOYK6_05925 [Chthoniobacterales bacterium]